jgi:hypothetical protein
MRTVGVRELAVNDHLQRHSSMKLTMVCLEDDSHPAAAQLLLNVVAGNVEYSGGDRGRINGNERAAPWAGRFARLHRMSVRAQPRRWRFGERIIVGGVHAMLHRRSRFKRAASDPGFSCDNASRRPTGYDPVGLRRHFVATFFSSCIQSGSVVVMSPAISRMAMPSRSAVAGRSMRCPISMTSESPTLTTR